TDAMRAARSMSEGRPLKPVWQHTAQINDRHFLNEEGRMRNEEFRKRPLPEQKNRTRLTDRLLF
ncbi:hypothetical protein, partial [Bacteroides clarus]|uniref:hypothetical protein n=1 Tax=Bacteroides clarus TaxID=626929 RepID=UPI002674EC3F